jgi:hypothetical protein
LTGLTAYQFGRNYVDAETASGLVFRWVSGEISPSPRKVRAIGEAGLPETVWIYFLELFQLLRPRVLEVAAVRKLQRRYLVRRDHNTYWVFPNDQRLREQGLFRHILEYDDAQGLMERGDLYAFTALVSLVREAEARGDAARHTRCCAWMYRSLPAVGRLPWVRPHFDLLSRCVDHLARRSEFTRERFKVDWTVIERQMSAKTHETVRERRPRDPRTLRYVDLEDPIVYFTRPCSADTALCKR